MKITKPAAAEHSVYMRQYIDLVPGENLQEALRAGQLTVSGMLSALSEEQWAYRYAPGKWSVKEMMLHIVDTERIFSFRALCFARGEEAMLPGFEQDDYAAASLADARSGESILEEYTAVRKATICLFGSFSPETALCSGEANNSRISVRALGYAIAGHEQHHLAVLRERYGVKTP